MQFNSKPVCPTERTGAKLTSPRLPCCPYGIMQERSVTYMDGGGDCWYVLLVRPLWNDRTAQAQSDHLCRVAPVPGG